MKGKTALAITLLIVLLISIAVLALTVVTYIDLQKNNNDRPNPDTPTAAPTGQPAPASDLTWYDGQLTDDGAPWNDALSNPLSPEFGQQKAYYEKQVLEALTTTSTILYGSSAVVVTAFSGEHPVSSVDTSTTATKVLFSVGVADKRSPANVSSDLENGAEISNFAWRGIDIEAAGPAPLPQADTSDGWKTAANMFLQSLNTSVDPCQNFFNYACDNYIAQHPLGDAATQSTFDDLQAIIFNNLTRALESLNNPASQALKVTGDVYKACKAVTNTSYTGPDIILSISNTYGGWPLLDPTWTIDKVPNNIYWAIGDMNTQYGVSTVFTPNVDIDLTDITRNVLFLDQASTQIPAAYYKNANLTQEYQTALKLNILLVAAELATWSGIPIDNATFIKEIDRMVQIEYYLATISVSDDDMRNQSLGFNTYDIATAQQQFSAFNWTSYFDGLLGSIFPGEDLGVLLNPFVIMEPRQYVRDLNTFFANLTSNPDNLRTFVNYQIYRLIMPYMQFAGPKLASIAADFRKATTQEDGKIGIKSMGKRDYSDQQLNCASFLTDQLQYAAGRLYVDDSFPPANRDDVAIMINNVLGAFSNTLSGLQWMDNESVLRAFQKVAGLIRNVAYPDFEQDDTDLDNYYQWLITNVQSIDVNDPQAFYKYVRQIVLFLSQKEFGNLNLPGDRTDFLMSPAIVNAWYQPERNSITFPAAILNEPFYRFDFPKAVNYGALGVVMGHELSHGFDDEGVQYDWNGTLNTWMTPYAQQGFANMAQCVVDEYDGFCYPQGCIDGVTTQGENIGDNGGLKAAYRAYKAYTDSHGDEPPLPGMETFSMDQIFFLSFAQVWCGSYSDAALTKQLLTNPHSPGKDRVIGAIQNFPKFGEAFQCQLGDPMYPVNDCDVW